MIPDCNCNCRIGLNSREPIRLGMTHMPTQIVGAEWGKIGGNLEDQVDLKNVLDEIRTLACAGL